MNINANTIARRKANQPPPDASELERWYKTREDLALIDYIGGLNASALGSKVASFNGVNSKVQLVQAIDLNRDWFLEVVSSDNNVDSNWDGIVTFGNITGTYVDGMSVTTNRFLAYTVESNLIASSSNNPVKSKFRKTRVVHDTTAKTIEIYYDDILHETRNYTGTLKTSTYITFGYQDVGTGYLHGCIAHFNFNDELVVDFNGHAKGTETNVSWIDQTTISEVLQAALSKGFYQRGNEQYILPEVFQDGDILHPANKFHNLLDSWIEFPAGVTIMDRSNATIYKQSYRDLESYDSSRPLLHKVSELLYSFINNHFQDAYQNRFFLSLVSTATKKYSNGMFLYQTKREGEKLTKTLKYTGND